MSTRTRRRTSTINLALQGGGAHGAFTWGVLDRLLEEETLVIDGISGTSAGAINGALVSCGLMNGGPERARAMLDRFWTLIAEKGKASPLQPTMFDRLFGDDNLEFNPAYHVFDMMTRMVSPYFVIPIAQETLRDALIEALDFGCLQACPHLHLYISATDVQSGKIKVFRPGEITVDALLASACLPHLHRAVEIDGSFYWDGGFMGNPALFPLLYECESRDIVLVQINPIERSEVPRTARAIIDRMNEISFNATLLRELRTIAVIDDLLERDMIKEEAGFRRAYVHTIDAADEMARLGVSSKLNVDLSFLCRLRDLGREAADEWLQVIGSDLGRRSTVDLERISI